ncbi:MAG: ABC transporter permease subunit [Phycisphaeraceae bacterium]|nr:ABC transporter permease subunit [Phycisphaeraceae bacterium]MCW5763272.1 ABC transporter permease subunit [Phycisphaeraceae bacterium]
MTASLTIARNTLTESLRQPVVFLLVITSGVLQLFSVWWSAYSMGYRNEPGDVTSDDKLLFDIGLSTIFVCGMLLAAFIATAVLSREIENKTVLTMVSKPLSRTSIVIGKFLGVAAAVLIAVVIMLVFLMLALRHGVMSTAADEIDMPVLVFGFGAVMLSLLIGAGANFLYGWSFPQTTVVSMLPLSLIAYFGVLAISEKWQVQPLTTDFKSQVAISCAALTMAILVMTAIAIAASTRLGQVMTIVVCAGAFMLGLLSNHLFGRHAFKNAPIASVAFAYPILPDQTALTRIGDSYTVVLVTPPNVELRPGMQFLYGPTPNGLGLAGPYTAELQGTDLHSNPVFPANTPSGLVVSAIDDLTLTIRHIGSRPSSVRRPPQSGDFVFLEPTRVNPVAAVCWAVLPNMHFFWLVDAVSQAKNIPISHLFLIIGYGLTQILTYLALAVALFQTRDVG